MDTRCLHYTETMEQLCMALHLRESVATKVLTLSVGAALVIAAILFTADSAAAHHRILRLFKIAWTRKMLAELYKEGSPQRRQ